MSLLESRNPTDGSSVWTGQAASEADVDKAVLSAGKALTHWRQLKMGERCDLLRRFATIVENRSEELAAIISREIGKPFQEAKSEVGAVAGKIEISIRAQEERCHTFAGGPAVTRFRPHGIVAVLGPYNFPAHLPNGHICPALLAGNVVIFKPSELAPATGELLVDCWHQAGIPGNVLQILQGGSDTAIALTSHPGLDGVFFTGSATTGKRLAKQFASTPGKILALEMGGNNPLIVDLPYLSNLGPVADTCVTSAFQSTGQRCTCARRLLLIESPEADGFLELLAEKARELVIDDPFASPAPFMGPLASCEFPAQILARQTGLIEAGATPLLLARHLRPDSGFISPGILDVTNANKVPDEEIFGPILQIIRVPDLETAIQRANSTRFGLAAGLISDSKPRYEIARERLRAGIINWNAPLTGASSAAPFGGIGDSGNLRPSAYFAADYCSYPVASIERPTCG